MSGHGSTPQDPPAASPEAEASSRADWQPEQAESWGPRTDPRPDWHPEQPDAWERVISERRRRDGRRRRRSRGRVRLDGGSRRRRSRRSSRRGRSSGRLELSHSSRSRRRRSRGWRRRRARRIVKLAFLVGGLLLLGLGAAVADAYYQSYQAFQQVQDVVPRLNAARSALAQGEVPSPHVFNEVISTVDRVQGEIDEARFTFGLAGSLPYLRRPVDAVRLGLDAAKEEAAAAGLIRDLVMDALGDQDDEVEQAPIYRNGKADLPLIRSFTPRMERLIAHLERAEARIREIPDLPFVGAQVAAMRTEAIEETRSAIELAEGALQGVRLLPSFLGGDEPRTYFLAMLNNADQRATGGDLLAYGFLEVEDGKLDLVDGGSIGRLDQKKGFPGAELPPEVTWYMEHVDLISNPRMRHANFTPDFPLVARAWASQLANSRNGRPVDGVIAVDPTAIARLIGPRQQIEIPSFPNPITASNAVDVIEHQQYLLPAPQQRAFPGELIGAAWSLLREPPNLIRAAQRLGWDLRENRLKIWTDRKDEQRLLDDLKWNGEVRVGEGDFLYVTDNKLQPNKVDYFTHMRIVYDVKLRSNGDADVRLEVTLDNRTPPDKPAPVVGRRAYALNSALIGAYVPKSAKLERAGPNPNRPVHVEQQARVFLTDVSALPEDPGVATFEYTVPGVVEEIGGERVYRLRVQHQPMSNVARLFVKVTPPDEETITFAPDWTPQEDGSVLYRVGLNRDLDLEVRF